MQSNIKKFMMKIFNGQHFFKILRRKCGEIFVYAAKFRKKSKIQAICSLIRLIQTRFCNSLIFNLSTATSFMSSNLKFSNISVFSLKTLTIFKIHKKCQVEYFVSNYSTCSMYMIITYTQLYTRD